MARGSSGIIGGITAFGMDAETSLVDGLFEVKNFKKLKQLTDITPDLIFPLTVAGVIQKKFKSKIIKSMEEELFLLEVAKDRKGRDEYAEVALAIRRGMGREEMD